jgi:hypothetical protein
MTAVGTARIINAIFWLWLWLSDVFNPGIADTGTVADFWAEKATQLFRLNESIFNDPARFAGNGIIPALLWFAIDRGLRRARR